MKQSEILQPLESKPGRDRKLLYLCQCGTRKRINYYNVKYGNTVSCGCVKKTLMRENAKQRFTGQKPANFRDFTGKKIGVITVKARVPSDDWITKWECECICGNKFVSQICNIRRCEFKKCMCGTISEFYQRLSNMIRRCENPLDVSYRWYGAKGIYVCQQWKDDIFSFIEWSKNNGYSRQLSIDRVDPSGPYGPENCQWITRSENSKKAMRDRWARKDMESRLPESKVNISNL